MVALTNKELIEAGGIPQQLVHEYSTARYLIALAEELVETNEEAEATVKSIVSQYPQLPGVYATALANLEEERLRQLNNTS